jgi:hypothetical protein
MENQDQFTQLADLIATVKFEKLAEYADQVQACCGF